MIITLSPAKLMDFAPISLKEKTKPLFEDKATELIKILKSFSIEEIKGLMKINPKQAFETYQHIQSFFLDKTDKKQAAYTYNGIAFQGLDYNSLNEDEALYGQGHLIILSGLYGVLQPFDIIKPYRLEMQAKLENEKGMDLYSFWTEHLTKYLITRLKKDDNIWVNLMSNEYTKVINKKALPGTVKVITPDFKEQTATGYRQVVVHTKKARGMFARFIIKNKISEIEHLKAFDEEGYSYSEELSKKGNLIFVR